MIRPSNRLVAGIYYGIFLAALLEIITRLFFHITGRDIDVYRYFSMTNIPFMYEEGDPYVGYKFIPNVSRATKTSEFDITYTTNSWGLREKEIQPTDKKKVLFLGDSETFGVGVPSGQRFSDLMEKEVKEIYSINAGVPGYGLHSMLGSLEHYLFKLEPDVIICVITKVVLERVSYMKLGSAPHLRVRSNNNLNWGTVSSVVESINNAAKKSYFYSFFKTQIKIALVSLNHRERDKKFWDEIWAKEKARNANADQVRIREEIVRNEAETLFFRMKQLARDIGSDLVIVSIDANDIAWAKQMAENLGIPYWSFSAELRNVPNRTYKLDPHYNVNGHRAIAELLVKYWSTRNDA